MTIKTVDLNEPKEGGNVTEADVVKTALQLLEALRDFSQADAYQTRIPARRDRVALCTSAPYKNAVEDQNKTGPGPMGVIQYPAKEPTIKALIALENDQDRLTYFDLEIEIAVGHLLDRATTSPVYLSPAQIGREYLGLVDNSATVSDELIKEIEKSMKRLQRINAYLEWSEQLQKFKRPPKNQAKAQYKGRLLEFREVVLMAGGQNVTGYEFTKDFLPMHYLHGKVTNQLIFPPAYALDTTKANAANLCGLPPKKSTVRFKLIQRYLYREIVRMIKTDTGRRGLLYETIYKGIGEPNPTPQQKQAIDRDIAYCLEHWQGLGIIKGYTAKARGKNIKKITITPPD